MPHVAKAQFGSLLRDATRGALADTDDSKCKGGKRSRGGNMLGSVLGGAASRAAGGTPLGSYLPLAEFRDTLTDAIACKLDPKEQAQAAGATTQAVSQAERSAGPQTSSWKSETRDNVSGTSTVDSQTKTADGTSCMMVTDVIIVDGEETRAQKRMCRKPGEARYTLAA
jgi:hypothetical protein